MEKKNIGLIILVIVLSIAVLGLGGFVVYDKILNYDSKNNSNDTNKVEPNNNVENNETNLKNENNQNEINSTVENNNIFENKIADEFTYDIVTKEIHKSLVGKYVDEATANTFIEIKENGEILLSIETCEGVSTYTSKDLDVKFMYSDWSDWSPEYGWGAYISISPKMNSNNFVRSFELSGHPISKGKDIDTLFSTSYLNCQGSQSKLIKQ